MWEANNFVSETNKEHDDNDDAKIENEDGDDYIEPFTVGYKSF